jgi:hypothetical protein
VAELKVKVLQLKKVKYKKHKPTNQPTTEKDADRNAGSRSFTC